MQQTGDGSFRWTPWNACGRRQRSSHPGGWRTDGTESEAARRGKLKPSFGRPIHCPFMTVPLQFHDMPRSGCGVRLLVLCPAKGFPAPVELCVPTMAPAPNPAPSPAVATTGLGSFGIVRWLAVAAPQFAALILT